MVRALRPTADPLWRGCRCGRAPRGEQATPPATQTGRTGTGNIKKSHGVFCEGVAVKYAWINQHRDSFPIAVMCDVLLVSTSGYYDSQGRQPSARAARHQRIQQAVQQVHAESHGIYGSQKVTEVL